MKTTTPRKAVATTGILALVLAAGIIRADAGVGEVTQVGSGGFRASAAISPVTLPRSRPAPITLKMGFTSPPVEEATPEIDRIEIDVTRHVSFRTAGIPSCPLAKLYSAPEDARESCPESLVGHGSVTSEITMPEQAPVTVDGRLLAFYTFAKGTPRILAQVITGEPLPLVYVIPFTIGEASTPYGTELLVSRTRIRHIVGVCVPGPCGGYRNPYTLEGVYSHISAFEMSLRRVVRKHSRRISFVSAVCPLPPDVSVGAVMPVEASLELSDKNSVSSQVRRECRARDGT